jgi:uncharacterized protein YcgL (UPF0745 family)
MDTYLYIKEKDEFGVLTDQLEKLLGRLEFVMEIDLDSRKKLANVEIDKLKTHLNEVGYYIQVPPRPGEDPGLFVY